MFADPRERIRVQHEQLGLYAMRVRVCLTCGQLYNDETAYQEALEAAEASRSRALLDALVEQLAPDDAPFELRDKFFELQRELRRAQRRLHQEWETLEALAKLAAETEDDNQGPGPESDDQSRQAETGVLATPRYDRSALVLAHELSAHSDQQSRIEAVVRYIGQRAGPYLDVVNQLRAIDASFQPDKSVDSFRWRNRAELFPEDKNTVFVHLEQVGDGCHAMILTRERLVPVPLPDLNREELSKALVALAAPQLSGLGANDMRELMLRVIPDVLSVLQRTLVQPLMPALEQAGLAKDDRLVFVPDGVMSFLPLHALEIGTGERLGDCYEVAYSRSLSMLLQCIRRNPPEPTNLFAMTDPTNSLAGPVLEAELARRYFPQADPLESVSSESILRLGHEAHVFYWMGHSKFWLRVPNWSGLQLAASGERQGDDKTKGKLRYAEAPKDFMTFTDIDCGLRMPDCSLVVLSGCQSGLAVPGKGNESISLVSAFLNAGAKCVLASLWPVDDVACTLTMQRFMQAWRVEGQSIAAALKTAQRWLRELKADELRTWCEECPELQEERFQNIKTDLLRRAEYKAKYDDPLFESPYYWAPFVAVGQSWNNHP